MGMGDYLRLAIILVGAMSFVAFAIRINDDWAILSRGWRVVRLTMLGIVALLGLGTLRAMLTDPPLPITVLTFLTFASTISLLFGLWLVRHDDPPVDGGWLRVSDLRALLDSVESAHAEPCHNVDCVAARSKMHEMIRRVRRDHGVPIH